MSRYHSYINSAKQILQLYKGDEPCLTGRQAFASFLKKYFGANKRFGSKDRKQINNLCFCFFRLGKAVMNVSLEEKILTALFLCSTSSNEILASLKPEWDNQTGLSIREKLLIINPPAGRAGSPLLIEKVFPWKEELSEGVEYEKFSESFFIQPDLFLRLRPGKEKIVTEKLNDKKIHFDIVSENCISLPNASKIDEVIELDKEAVVQDYNSQKTGEFLHSLKPQTLNLKPSLWDCCAGSGGKSIMAYDINPNIDLTVSDSRESILANLKKRFQKAEIKSYKFFMADVAHSPLTIHHSPFDLIIADVPCTGSGTWARTPEQLYFFDKIKIEKYASLQKKIVSNAIPHLKPGGLFIYITCSVFKKENEEVEEFIKDKFQLKLIKKEVLKGYDKKADSMFVAILQNPL